jgi:hypothetical protein
VLSPRDRDSSASLEVELRDGSRHTTGLLDFLWQRPNFPSAKVSDD